jgi:cytoskeleton protein RodZ
MKDTELKEESIGNYLKAEREKRKISIKIVSQHTRINATMLEHLENDDKENLPNIAYSRGYVKSYAKILNLDLDHCLNLFDKTYNVKTLGTSHTQASAPAPKAPTKSQEKVPSNINTNYLVAGIGLVIAGLTVFFLVSKQKEEVKPTIAVESVQTIEEVSPEVVVAEATPIPTPTAVPTIVATPTPAPTATPVAVTKKEEVKVKEEINLRQISGPMFSIDKTTPATEVANFLPDSAKSSLIQGKQNIFINATDGDTWITYKSDDEAAKKFVLQQGRTILIRGDLVRVFLGNVNATKVFLNNQLLDLESRSGVKSLIFPADRSKDFKLPLFIYPENGTVITSDEYEASL